MQEHIRRRSVVAVMVILIWAAAGLMGARAEVRPEPRNQVVIIVDGSDSYRTRQAEAIQRATQLLESMGQTRLYRWESGTDSLAIVSLDAMPEVIWSGNLKDLKAMDPKDWSGRFTARKDLASCTDVTAAFRVAVRHLEGDPRYVTKYLFAFSDLLHEPPTGSVTRCERPQAAPTADFPWESLRDVAVSIFWVPPDQKLVWQRAAQKQGLESNFVLYSDSQSAEATITPPPRPVFEPTPEEREQKRAQVRALGQWVLRGLGTVLAAIVGLVTVVLIVGLVLKNRRSPRRLPPPRPMRPGRPQSRAPGRPLLAERRSNPNPNHRF